MGRQIFGIHPVYQETFFAHPQTSSSAPYPQELHSTWKKTIEETNSHVYSGESGRPETRSRSEMPVWTVSQRFSHLQWRETVQRFMGTDQQRLQISDLHFDRFPTPSNLCLLEDKVQDRGLYLFTIFLRKQCNGSRKWSWLIQWMN